MNVHTCFYEENALQIVSRNLGSGSALLPGSDVSSEQYAKYLKKAHSVYLGKEF
jgi:hypothetical protein